ncbi:MAG: SGNH/GDSL hydrolase family protein [Clostridia bacterium]|nr:SGNH/GDSL hydrolase family protein [Clostridia bacterium]
MKKRFIPILCVFLVMVMIFSACNKTEESAEETTAATTTVGETEATTTAVQTTALPPIVYGEMELDVNWNCGYVAAPWNNGASSVLMENASGYSYSDIIRVTHAGTKISFKVSAMGAADDSILVFSVWNEANGRWEMAPESNCFYAHPSKKTAVSQYSGGSILYTYVTANNWENIRLCYKSGQTSTNGATIKYPTVTMEYTGESSSLEKYSEVNKVLIDWLAESKGKTNYTCLEGKTINFLGDSYFEGDGIDKRWTWPALLGQKYNMSFVNHGMGGTTIANVNSNSMVNRYTKLPDNNPDIVIIEGGRNDFNNNVPIGNNTDTDTTTFKGGLNKLIDGVKEKYPNALIICVTPWYYHQNLPYGNAMIELCQYKGVLCFNAMDRAATGVDVTDSNFLKNYTNNGNSISHLNIEGMKLVFPAFEKFIAEQYEASIT